MKKLSLGLVVLCAFAVGCLNPAPPPKFIKYDRVLITDDRALPADELPQQTVGIVVRRQIEPGNTTWYKVEFADGTSHDYHESQMTLLNHFDWLQP